MTVAAPNNLGWTSSAGGSSRLTRARAPRASGTGRGSWPRGVTTRCGSSATSSRRSGPCTRSRSMGRDWYRYSCRQPHGDPPDGRTLRLLAVDVTPAPDGQSLVVGKMWLDSATAEMVRFSFRYVGTGQWVAPEARRRRTRPTRGARNNAGQPARSARRRPGVLAAGWTLLDAVPAGHRRTGEHADGRAISSSRSRR